MSKILFATSNEGKLLEVERFLSPLDFEVEQLNVPYPEIQSSDLEEVALFGMDWLSKAVNREESMLLEDAGLFVHALNDFPGVYSAYIYKSIGLEGILRLMGGKEDRGAHFESVIAYFDRDSGVNLFKGRADGSIALEIKGEHGFGYDPIFVPEGENRTFGEMATEEKNRYSHRGRSLSKLADFLSKR